MQVKNSCMLDVNTYYTYDNSEGKAGSSELWIYSRYIGHASPHTYVYAVALKLQAKESRYWLTAHRA